MSEMKIAWRDASSYSRGERGTVEPTAWEIVSASPGRMRVCVHRVHRLEGWFVTCHELRIDRRELGDVTLDEAKMSALKLVAQTLDDLSDQFDSIRRAHAGEKR